MKLRTVGYYFKQTFSSIIRNFWMSLASIGTVAITLFILGAAFLLTINASFIASSVESDVEINAYLESSLSYTQAKEIANSLETMSGVANIEFVSKDKALKGLKEDLSEGEGEVIGALGGINPLPDSYKIKATEPTQVSQLALKIEGIAGVESVRYGQGVVETLFKVTKWVKRAGLVVMAALFLATLFLISTTIRLTVSARSREIEIMKFLGATNWFIRWPFLLEGIFLGLLGSAIAVLIITFGYTAIIDQVQNSFTFMPLKDDTNTYLFLLEGLIGIGVIIGALGSMFSMHKYLKV